MVAAGRIAAPHPQKELRPRYASGRAKAPTPNPRVVADRRMLLGDPTAKGAGLRHGENALDLMLARGWLTTPLHEAAVTVRRLYHAAFPAFPDLKTAQIAEAPGRSEERGHAAPQLPRNPDGNPDAMATLRAIWRVMDLKPLALPELIDLCLVPGAWPSWLVAMIEKRPLTGAERQAREALFWGLHNVNAVLASPQIRALAA